MGKYFRTSSPKNLDFMYQLPQELMLKATQQVSDEISQLQAGALGLHDKVVVNALEQDKPEAKALVEKYTQRIDELANQVYEDPLAFRKKTGEIVNLGRDIQKTWTSGEAAAYNNRYAAGVAYRKQMDDLVKAGRVKDPFHAQLMVNWNMENQDKAKYDPVTGKYNSFSEEFLTPDEDYREKYNKIAKEMEAKITATSGSSTNGQYITSSGRKVEIKSKEDIQNVLMEEFMSDEGFHRYLKQRSKIKAMDGYLTEDGQVDSPYGVIGTNAKGKAIYGWKNNKLGLMFSGITDANAKYNVLDSHSSMSSDSNYGYAVEAMRNTAAAPPNTKNTTMKVRAVPRDVDTLLEQKTRNVFPMVASSIQAAIKDMPADKVQAALADLKAAEMAFAQNGNTDITPVAAVYAKYFPKGGDPVVEQQLMEYSYNRAVEASNSNFYNQAVEKIKAKYPTYNYSQIQNKLNTILASDDVMNVNANLFATSGNSEELWTNPITRDFAVRNSKTIAEFAKDPTAWGSSFFYVTQDEDDEGNPKFDAKGQPIMVTKEANNATLSSNGTLNFQTIKKSVPNVGATPETVSYNMEDTGNVKGKATNAVGQPQFIPMNFKFDYQTFDKEGVKTEEASKDSWLIRIPLTSGTNASNSYVLIRGDQITNDQFDQLKREGNFAASAYSINLEKDIKEKALQRIDEALK